MLQDLVKFGMIPEFVGRLPNIATLEKLDKEALRRILTEPKNALVQQYKRMMEVIDGVELVLEDDAVEAIAEEAIKRHTGARALRAIMEEIMLDVMFEVPSESDVTRCVITREAISEGAKPCLERKSGTKSKDDKAKTA